MFYDKATRSIGYLKDVEETEKQVLADLMQDYLGEFSKLLEIEKDENGKFVYKYFDLYWKEENRKPFFIIFDQEIAGFVLVNLKDPLSLPEKIHEIAEFYIIKRFRNKRLGENVAFDAFWTFPGEWVVRVRKENKLADKFWRRMVDMESQGEFSYNSRNDELWRGHEYRFSNAAPNDVIV